VTDALWMEQALALAALGEGTASPNPLVGCVIVRDGAVLGRGFHRASGEPHAEVLALCEAGERARGASLYVNLEPCAHQGRTGPCSDAIIRAGVVRVVAAVTDPNPLVNGRGLRALRDSGIDVVTGVGAREARSVNAPFLSTHERGRPWVTLKAAQSLDGLIAAASGSSTWISGEASRRYAHRLRFRSDAVLVGAGTVRRDDPRLTVRLPGVAASRLRAVLAPRLGLDPNSKVFARVDDADPRTRVYVAASTTRGERAALHGVAEVVPIAETPSGLDLDAVLADLRDQGVQSLLIEGGGKTSGAFLSAGRVDEIALFVAGRLFGAAGATPWLDLQTVPAPEAGWRLRDTRIVPLGGDALVLGRPEAP